MAIQAIQIYLRTLRSHGKDLIMSYDDDYDFRMIIHNTAILKPASLFIDLKVYLYSFIIVEAPLAYIFLPFYFLRSDFATLPKVLSSLAIWSASTYYSLILCIPFHYSCYPPKRPVRGES